MLWLLQIVQIEQEGEILCSAELVTAGGDMQPMMRGCMSTYLHFKGVVLILWRVAVWGKQSQPVHVPSLERPLECHHRSWAMYCCGRGLHTDVYEPHKTNNISINLLLSFQSQTHVLLCDSGVQEAKINCVVNEVFGESRGRQVKVLSAPRQKSVHKTILNITYT